MTKFKRVRNKVDGAEWDASLAYIDLHPDRVEVVDEEIVYAQRPEKLAGKSSGKALPAQAEDKNTKPLKEK